jgi:glutamate-5-semialdehyde dehydrogenase
MVTEHAPLVRLEAGQLVPFGGDRVAVVDADLAAAFQPGDRLVVVQETGDLLRVPAVEHDLVHEAVTEAIDAFAAVRAARPEAIDAFYDGFARCLADDAIFAPIAEANAADVASAQARGRSTTRLVLTPKMRAAMVEALQMWRHLPSGADEPADAVEHDGWRVESRRAPLGLVGFVFEGRPNVLADATGVLRSGNVVVFRIGSDALGTARAIMEHALVPALRAAGLPEGAVRLVDSPSHAAGWALFADRRVGLAVARGSGPAVAQLGAVARQTGTPVSLHGTGGAWMVVTKSADPQRLASTVAASLDRKVCNTLNVCCVTADAADLLNVVADAADAAAAATGAVARLHVVGGDAVNVLGADRFGRTVTVRRPEGVSDEPQADVVDEQELATEWEWEADPELTVTVVRDLDHAVELFERYSPRFVASLLSDDPLEQEQFWAAIDAPFVGDGFTRWVDGQYALGRPELGLSNWQHGRLFARGGVLAGDGVYTVRLRVTQHDPAIAR